MHPFFLPRAIVWVNTVCFHRTSRHLAAQLKRTPVPIWCVPSLCLALGLRQACLNFCGYTTFVTPIWFAMPCTPRSFSAELLAIPSMWSSFLRSASWFPQPILGGWLRLNTSSILPHTCSLSWLSVICKFNKHALKNSQVNSENSVNRWVQDLEETWGMVFSISCQPLLTPLGMVSSHFCTHIAVTLSTPWPRFILPNFRGLT